MNPDEAYRLHTDWVRAVRDDSSNHAAWMRRRVDELAAASPTGAHFRRLGEPQTLASFRRTGPLMDTRTVVGYEPAAGVDVNELPTDVYDIASVEPEPGTVSAEQIAVPLDIYSAVTIDALASAPTYYVTENMTTVMEHAAAAFDDTDLMPRMPTRNGFVVLARPILLPLGDGKFEPVRAFAWNTWGDIGTSMGTKGQCGDVWTFSSRKHDAGFTQVDQAHELWTSKKAWRDDPDLLPSFCDWLITGTSIPPTSESAAEADARARAYQWFVQRTQPKVDPATGKMTMPDAERWSALLTAAEARQDQFLAEETAKDSKSRYGYFQPYLAAFVLLLTQQITVADKQPASATSVRLAGRVSQHRPSDVTVVDLRPRKRTDSESAAEPGKRGPVTVHHWVDGHWKWQPYGAKRSLRRRIYLSGYDRGPEDQPLVVKPRVKRLS
jgi:hypothetical protein